MENSGAKEKRNKKTFIIEKAKQQPASLFIFIEL